MAKPNCNRATSRIHEVADLGALVTRPIEEITEICRIAGRTAFVNAEVVEDAAGEIRFEWIGRAFPSGMGMSEKQFNNIIKCASAAFDEGIDEYKESLRSGPPPRLPGVSYFFSEDFDFEYGVQIDLSRMDGRRLTADALYDRIYSRLLFEFDSLMRHILTSGEQVKFVGSGKPPISTEMLVDDVFLFRIVPVALTRRQLQEKLTVQLREFVDYMVGSDAETSHV